METPAAEFPPKNYIWVVLKKKKYYAFGIQYKTKQFSYFWVLWNDAQKSKSTKEFHSKLLLQTNHTLTCFSYVQDYILNYREQAKWTEKRSSCISMTWPGGGS